MHILSFWLRCSVIVIGTWFSTATAANGKLYKWIDDNGQIRYSDHVPPQYADKGNERLNNQGLVVDVKQPAKTEEQLANESRLAELAEQEDLKKKERALHDRILLDTFTNEEEMVLNRRGKIESIEANIRVTNGRIDKLKQKLAQLNGQAASMERAGKTVPASITKQISESRTQIQKNLEYIENRKLEQQSIREKFELDIKRFRELNSNTANEQR
ncbi:MAG: DUF4124 domain-containing protein [Thiogranum sp.]|nr:DUF4124 domain-containing protein [Thiogranum sp.]